jgi:hypothetical protein
MMTLGDEGRVRSAMDRIKTWMRSHGAGVLVENLADGATPERLANTKPRPVLPYPLGYEPYGRSHAGQHTEQNGFVGHLDLLGPVTPCTWILYSAPLAVVACGVFFP